MHAYMMRLFCGASKKKMWDKKNRHFSAFSALETVRGKPFDIKGVGVEVFLKKKKRKKIENLHSLLRLKKKKKKST